MREFNAINGLPDDVIYKEVVVIGNGPSGICMSYQLAGHSPVLRKDAERHPEPMLDARIRNTPCGRPLPMQTFHDLAGGLEGRSQNPIPLLVDNLTHPGADMGIDLPSMLEWKYFPEKQIDHVVLGRGRAGGLWNTLDSSVVTLSPSRWMALPGQPNLSDLQPEQRVPVPLVANYYQHYVKQSGIQKFFRNHTMVTSVKPIKATGKLGGVNPPEIAWCVCGYDTANQESFRYVCSRVILATGASDKPNSIKGGRTMYPISRAIRTPSRLQSALDSLTLELERTGKVCPPILVIGSGLSAADAILRARACGLAVAHAYRSPSAALRALPPTLYPEYHQVHQMMINGVNGRHPLYTALPDHIILDGVIDVNNDGSCDEEEVDIHTPQKIKLLNTKTNNVIEIDISLCVILIGSRPDLHFLPEDFNSSYLTFDPESEQLKPDLVMSNNRRLSNDKQNTHSAEMCIKCSYNSTNRLTHDSICFIKTQWHNFKYIVGQGLHKSRQYNRSAKDNASNNRSDLQELSSSGESISDKNLFNYKCSLKLNGEDHSVLNDLNHVEYNEVVESNVQGSGTGLGINSDRPIDSKTNPIFIDKYTHAVQNAPKGMYTLGPLAGDNFVRFIPGGALAIVSSIWNDKKLEENECN